VGIVGRVLTGFVVAVLCTPAGISGAFLVLPVQMQVFNVPSPAVSATNLLYNVVSAPAGALTYFRQARLDTKLAVALCTGTAPGVVIGAIVRSTWLADPDQFGIIASVLLLGLGARLLVDARRPADDRDLDDAPLPPRWRLNAVGLVAGLIGGVYGLGGAALIVPWLVSVERLPVSRVAGAGLVTTMVTSTIGLATFALAEVAGVGKADAPRWIEGLALGIGGLAGAVVGARLQPRVPVPALKVLLAVAAIAAGVRTIP
jgi:uncharacterized protein